MGKVSRPFVVIIAALAIAAAGLAGTSFAESSASKVAKKKPAIATLAVENPNVSVKKKGAETFVPATNGQKLRQGDTIQTDGTGRATVNYTDDAYTRLDVNTTMTIEKLTEDQGARQIKSSLDTGRTWNRTEALTESGEFEQSGAGATAAVAGTAFMMTCETPNLCTTFAGFHQVILRSENGETRFIPEFGECTSDDAVLCAEVRILTPDEVALIAFVQEMYFRDLVEHSFGPGPTMTSFQGNINVANGQVTSFAIIQQPTTIPTTTTTTTNTTSSGGNPTLPPPAPPVIDANAVNVQSLGESDPSVTGGSTGAHDKVVTEDEVNGHVTFVLQATNPDGSAFYLIFTDLPDPKIGTLYVGTSAVLVDLVTHYTPDTVFRFDPVQIEPVCDGGGGLSASAGPAPAECYTDGFPTEGPDVGNVVPFPAPVTDNGNGTVSWSDAFTFKAVDESSGVESPEVTVPIVVYDDICGEDSERQACDVLDSGSTAADAPPESVSPPESEAPPAEPDVPEQSAEG